MRDSSNMVRDFPTVLSIALISVCMYLGGAMTIIIVKSKGETPPGQAVTAFQSESDQLQALLQFLEQERYYRSRRSYEIRGILAHVQKLDPETARILENDRDTSQAAAYVIGSFLNKKRRLLATKAPGTVETVIAEATSYVVRERDHHTFYAMKLDEARQKAKKEIRHTLIYHANAHRLRAAMAKAILNTF